MKNISLLLLTCVIALQSLAQKDSTVTKRDRKKRCALGNGHGQYMGSTFRFYPPAPDNFLKLVKMHYYDGILFHRVIQHFMIQSGDPDSRGAAPGTPLGEGGPNYVVPAEFRPTLFHKKGVIAAARDNNPTKASSASQFYLTQGKVFTEAGLDSVETYRLKRKIPAEQRKVYTTLGGVPHLDQNYTVFGEIVKGLEVVDKIAAVPTSKGKDKDRPLQDVAIIKAKLVKRKKH